MSVSPRSRGRQASRRRDLCIIRSHASGYAHPEIAVTVGVLSALLNHPFPTLVVTLALKDGGGSFDSVPVAVYYGSAVTLPGR